MDRERAISLVKQKVKNKNLIKHMLATEAIMRKLAEHFGEEIDIWGLAGLVHDVDYDETLNTPELHGKLGAKMLDEVGADAQIIQAVLSHCPHYSKTRESRLEIALYASDPLSGLIVAAALIHPDKKLKSLNTAFVLKRFGEKWFAKGANRDQIKACQKIDIPLEQFIEIGLLAMQGIANDLGL